MNNVQKSVFTAAGLIVAMLMSIGIASAAKPVPYSLDPEHFQGEFFFDCSVFGMPFALLADWVYLEYGLQHFDNQGNLVRVTGFGRVVEPRAYNSTDPSKELTRNEMVGTTEHWQFTVRIHDGIETWYRESGISFRAVVPGIGSLVMDAGTVIWESEDGIDWFPHVQRPNSTSGAENFSLCSYLQ